MKEKKQSALAERIVVPAVSPEEAKAQWLEYQNLKKAIVDKKVDIQNISGHDFLCKSYWRKLATYFNISTEILEEKPQQLGGELVWHFTIKAIAPNGRYSIGVGSCSQMEKGRKNTIHNTRATAETRAQNRAISNLVGGGEVSAEEAEQGITVDQVKEVFPEDKGSKPMSKAEQVKEKAKQWQNRK